METKVEMFFQGKKILVGTPPPKKKSFNLKWKTAYIAGYLCFTYIGVHIYKD